MAEHTKEPLVVFETDPGRYRHWRVSYEGPVARLRMDVDEEAPLREGYVLKLNSYDLGVDIELADAIERLRFEHPEVRCLVVESAKDRVFCSGANIYMLGSSTHAFKVNFCKYTNETRIYLEELSRASGVKSLCAIDGPCAGGGYELAMACDEIHLVDDGSSAVSLPEVPLLGVLPGTGGLTRLTDKRLVRRDRADHFATLSEGIRGKRAVAWGLVDRVTARSRFGEAVAARAAELASSVADRAPRTGPGIPLTQLQPEVDPDRLAYRHVTVTIDRSMRVAEVTVAAPSGTPPASHGELLAAGADAWMLRCFRELDDAILRMRFNEPTIGLWVVRTSGDGELALAWDRALLELASGGSWLASEIVLQVGRTLRRLELSARTIFAIVDETSCFAGCLLELALAADRTYMLDKEGVTVTPAAMSLGSLLMSNGLTRLGTRFWGYPAQLEAADAACRAAAPLDAARADEVGLVTARPDDIDWDDEVRLAIEERASLSPDALTGLEASLRFPGPETLETKIFARLSAWQNWIFQRPNAVGERGALTMYGQPERPQFDWRRT